MSDRVVHLGGEAAQVSTERYTSPAYAALEWERVFRRTWLLAGREADLAEVGDQRLFEIGPESIVLVRSAPGEVRAFYNVCTHRGSRVVTCSAQRASSLRCPYHSWEWHLDGRIKRLTDPTVLARGADPAEIGLRPVRCATSMGFVWITLDPDAPHLEAYLGSIAPRMAPYLLEEHALVRDLTVEWECNWKVCLDNSNETYHVGTIHPQLLDILDDEDTRPELHGDHSCFWVRFAQMSPKRAATRGVPHGLSEFFRKFGGDTSVLGDDVAGARALLKQTVRAFFQERGFSYPGLDDDGLVDNFHVHVFPNVMFNVLLPGYWLFRARPHPTDPTRMYVDFQEYERVGRGTKPPPRPPHVVHPRGEPVAIDSVVDQDAAIVGQVQRGMASSSCQWVRFGAQEARLRHMHEVLDRYILR
jgi:phenylpropionate dioxygenase-like ring-hydroxylating dioxygenase large terminal subunit